MHLDNRLIDLIPGGAGDLRHGPIFVRNGANRSERNAVDRLLTERAALIHRGRFGYQPVDPDDFYFRGMRLLHHDKRISVSDCNWTEGVTTTALAARTCADTNAGVGTVNTSVSLVANTPPGCLHAPRLAPTRIERPQLSLSQLSCRRHVHAISSVALEAQHPDFCLRMALA